MAAVTGPTLSGAGEALPVEMLAKLPPLLSCQAQVREPALAVAELVNVTEPPTNAV